MFSELLKELRVKKGISQSQLAKAVGVSAGNVGDWEVGKSKPGYTALAELSKFLGVSSDFLLELPHENQGEKEKKEMTCEGIPLLTEEINMIAMYRLLPEEHRNEIFDFLYIKYKRVVEQGNEYTYSRYTGTNGPQRGHPDDDDMKGTA